MEEILVKKKRKGQVEPFQSEKIHKAIRKSADRVLLSLTDEDCDIVSDLVLSKIEGNEISVTKLHKLVEVCLDETGFSKVAESYRQYRNYKLDALKIMEAVDKKTLELQYKADRSNANTDSALVSTKRSILYSEQQKERYKRTFLKPDELEAIEDGFIYIHDLGARLDTYNCCLLDAGRIMKGGFTLSTIDYTEPGSVEAAIAVLSDIMSVVAGNQYGGLTIPQVDEVLSPYCEKSYEFYINQYKEIVSETDGTYDPDKADKYAEERVRREITQGYQGIEHTFNSVSSCRGDFPLNLAAFLSN